MKTTIRVPDFANLNVSVGDPYIYLNIDFSDATHSEAFEIVTLMQDMCVNLRKVAKTKKGKHQVKEITKILNGFQESMFNSDDLSKV